MNSWFYFLLKKWLNLLFIAGVVPHAVKTGKYEKQKNLKVEENKKNYLIYERGKLEFVDS